MLSVSVDTEKAEKLLKEALGGLATSVDTNAILDIAGAALLNRQRKRFLAEVDPDGLPWVPSKAGLERRSKGGTGTLFKTGTLFHSIQLHSEGPLERVISTDVPYGVKHQEGFGVIERRFLGFNEDDQQVFTRIVKTEINKLVKDQLAIIGAK